ncbi:MAG: trypsin-like serine protease [Deltaproteobacteria bacterium]|nr:trypsin-like serine protease [Deltaproteobacteria bacterium]
MKKLVILLTLLSFFSCSKTENSVSTHILYGTLDTVHTGVVYIDIDGAGCSGTLIAPDIVLTAAHCIGSPGQMTVYFGESEPYTESRNVIEAMAHPDWTGLDTEDLTYDIGLVRLETAAPSSAQIIPPLPFSMALETTEIGNTVLDFLGYGITESGDSGTRLIMDQVLRYLCPSSGGYCSINVQVDNGTMNMIIPPSTLGIQMNNSGGICHGDSGGPALVVRNGTEYVAGVNSFVIHNNSDECDFFGAATRVAQYEQFINDFINPEDCSNGVDDDGDGFIDCDDDYCFESPECLPSVCDSPLEINCGDTLTSSTLSNSSMSVYSYYNQVCTDGFTIDGPENAWQLLVPAGSDVSISLELSSNDQDLELLLLSGECFADSCIDASTNAPGENESLQFTTDGNPYYIIVDTWQNPGEFTISVNCENVNPSPEVCDNLVDDDLDGHADCDDSDCFESEACQVVELCSNGLDDDGDGDVDCDDSDCLSDVACQVEEICSNDIDDDNDNLIDCDDPDCANDVNCQVVEPEICNNQIDDDLDGYRDCDDSDCSDDVACQGPDLENCTNETDDDDDGDVDCDDSDCASHQSCVGTVDENCSNGVDDDGDGAIDCFDADCTSTSVCLSLTEVCDNNLDDDLDGAADCEDVDCYENCGLEMIENCSNGVDDDGDGRIDCNDPFCKTSSLCLHPRENCTNGVDDDGDGRIDCDDADCFSFEDCSWSGEECSDGIDNDDDSLVDCDDPDCSSHFYCNLTSETNFSSSSNGCSCSTTGNTGDSKGNLFIIFSILMMAASLRKLAFFH